MPSSPYSRRAILGAAAALPLLPWVERAALGQSVPGLQFGPAQPFSFEALIAEAKARAARPYAPPYMPRPDVTERLDYEDHGKIKFRTQNALFAEGPGAYPVTFFHLGRFFRKSVRVHAVAGGQAREVLYRQDYFEMPADSPARELPADSGFAGFRFQESRRRADWRTQDWGVFLGASYFRAIGSQGQYGLSARGIAVNTSAPGTTEEFPDFVAFYIEPAQAEDGPPTVHALMDGPSIAGAYRFRLYRGEGVTMDVENRLFARAPIAQLGIAALTSMYQFSEHDKHRYVDWRPEVHDSDGIALWTGRGERLWRPLNNPTRVVTSSFSDENPKGFGLMQRDRNSENYQDGVNFERRPNLWVEPLGNWGAGSVQLVEIPTDEEFYDNIAGFWSPRQPIVAGTELAFAYRLHWLSEEPYPARDLARTFATRVGRGSTPGRREKGHFKFAVDFAGGVLPNLSREATPAPVISASRGRILEPRFEPVPHTQRWRARFELAVPDKDPVELRLFVRLGEQALSETWLYQFHPFDY